MEVGTSIVILTLIILFNIYIDSFICTQSNDSTYYYVVPIILFRHTIKEFQVLLFNTNKYSTLLILYLHIVRLFQEYDYVSVTIQLDISHLFAHCLDVKTAQLYNVKQFYLTQRQDPIRCYHYRSKWFAGSNGNERVLRICQISRTRTLPSDGLILYPGHLLGRRRGRTPSQRCCPCIL